jgi:hypothetical protein
MQSLEVSRTATISLAIILVISAAGCTRSRSEQPARSSQATAAHVAAISGATAPPGAERCGDDPHPERVDLSQVTKESLARGITSYVRDEANLHGGVFAMQDPQQSKTLELNLTTVHEDRLSGLGDGRFFACADFKGSDGHTYDVDVFMKPQSEGGFAPTDVLVHKQDGKARFNWVEQDGRWSQVPTTTP